MPENNQLFYRSLEFNREWLDEEKRTADLSFSSETDEVERWFGIEILDHNPRAVDLRRLRTVSAHIFNHNSDRIIGPVNSAKIENGRGVASVGYDDTDEGNLAFERTRSGSLRGVSFGYRVQVYRELMVGEEYQLASRVIKGRKDVSIYIATKWEPIEITSTAIPADSSIGLGRDLTRSLDGIEIKKRGGHSSQSEELEEMNEQQIREIIRDEIRAAMGGSSSGGGGRNDEDVVVEEERAVINRASAVSTRCMTNITQMLLDGKSVNECSRSIHQAIKSRVDTSDQGGNSAEGTGRTTKPDTTEKRITSFQQMSNDDDFFRAFSGKFDMPSE